MPLTLNVGCGADRYGDIRLDVSRKFLNYDMCPNVLADAQHLPFRDKTFTVVKCSDVLEHLPDPFQAMRELVRVNQNCVVVRVPTERDIWPVFLLNVLPPKLNLRYVMQARREHMHLWIMTPWVMMKFLRSMGLKVRFLAQSFCMIPMLEYGRKARFLRWISQRLRVRMEHFFIATKP